MWNDILFDLDGTLIDPAEGITGSAAYALEQMGVTGVPQKELECFIGPPLDETFSAHFDIHGPDIQTAIDHYKEHFRLHGVGQNKLFAGIPGMLQTLQSAGRRLYIATTKPVDLAVTIMDSFDISKYFTHIQGSEPGHNGRPKDEIIDMALQATDINPQNAVMVGDRRHDVAGAHAHGLPCVGVLFGYGGLAELQTAGAEHTVKDIDELQALLLAH